MIRLLLFGLGSIIAIQAATVAADSERGEQLFGSLSCIQCHSINGKGGKVAVDLGRRIDRNFTPVALAGTMWNHAPTMWAAMRDRQIGAGVLDEQAAADLFAYFYSVRFFDKPGDAGRGKGLFSSKHCADCHGLETAKIPAAKPVSQWESLGHPIILASAMWNHGASMREEFDKRNLRRPELTTQDLSDILVYLRNLPATRNSTVQFATSSGANGKELFESKGCVKCHVGNLTLEPRLKGKTLTDIAVDMWNHQPKMATVPATLDAPEMRELVSYLWAQQFFAESGNAGSGKRVFVAKHCASCHGDASSGAPKLSGTGRSFSAVTIVSALWRHGPRMLEQMTAKRLPWPRFEGHEMSDLIAYLNDENRVK
jgi:mono/diheme cytochrome c family protein